MKKITLILISIHGKISYSNTELGIDLDTGGQVKYILELIESLSKHKDIESVYLFTRLFTEKNKNYYNKTEIINNKAKIIRLKCGPIDKYLKKEELWDHLWEYVDESYKFIRDNNINPNYIHGHYAESTEIASLLSSYLDIPLIINSHSLGKNKLKLLLRNNLIYEEINKLFKIERRIEAEEISLENSELIINSTTNEIKNQWIQYDVKNKKHIVISPGVNKMIINKNYSSNIINNIEVFYNNLNKQIILLLSRPSKKKNIESVIEAYAKSNYLKENCNLLLILGNRDNICKLDKDSSSVFISILLLIDKYNLYGKVSYPKKHQKNDIPIIYDYVKKKNGIFVNPAFIEPFGITLIEAAQFGLPIISTKIGGPVEIINNLNNGLLIDPYSINDIQSNLEKIIKNKELFTKYSISGLENHHKYSWETYCKEYIENINKIEYKKKKNFKRTTLFVNKKILFTDIDNTLLGDDEAYNDLLEKTRNNIVLCLISGRDFRSINEIINKTKYKINNFDIIISSVGTEIYLKNNKKEFIKDEHYSNYIYYRWNSEKMENKLNNIKNINIQKHIGSQSLFKKSYDITDKINIKSIKKELRKNDLFTNIICSHDKYLDFIPIRASKGRSIRYLIDKYNLKYEYIIVAGDSGNDLDMMTGIIKSIVVKNYSKELEILKKRKNVYFSNKEYSKGILDGLIHYNFIPS